MGVKEPEKSKHLKEVQIPASNCCTRLLYNIPQGTLLLMLPGLTLTIIGIVFVIIERDILFKDGVIHVGIVLLVLGGGLTVGATTFCLWSWYHQQPKKPRRSMVSPHHYHQPLQQPVQLIGIYRITTPEVTLTNPHDVSTLQLGSVT